MTLTTGGDMMNIQIFGTKKSFDTKKAQRYFQDRRIPFQFIDLKEKGLSPGEFSSVKQAVGGIAAMVDTQCKDKDALALIQYSIELDKEKLILDNQQVLVMPIVRNGKKATIGYCPDVWKQWE